VAQAAQAETLQLVARMAVVLAAAMMVLAVLALVAQSVLCTVLADYAALHRSLQLT
jgi:hypothetical protein